MTHDDRRISRSIPDSVRVQRQPMVETRHVPNTASKAFQAAEANTRFGFGNGGGIGFGYGNGGGIGFGYGNGGGVAFGFGNGGGIAFGFGNGGGIFARSAAKRA